MEVELNPKMCIFPAEAITIAKALNKAQMERITDSLSVLQEIKP